MDVKTDLAVIIENVCKHFGVRKSKKEVLKGINITIPEGIIYGLLGPSGCGKTTLLKCLVGRLLPDKGFISIHGETPGEAGSSIPGVGVGYMPQDLAVYEKFTIAEMLMFFGRIYKMKTKNIQSRTTYILNVLQLEHKNKLIEKLSSGQKRRVSFAVALLHEPALLILDEPTVGVDPILRESIWEHLQELCSNSHVTIIITTHYIEEATQATKVGLMRNGRMLAEDKPKNFLNQHNLPSLENVYLKLCREDDIAEVQSNDELKESPLQVKSDNISAKLKKRRPNYHCFHATPSGRRIVALIFKSLTILSRILIAQIFITLNPAIMMTFFCITIGKDPRNVPVAVANEDQHYGLSYLQQIDKETIFQIPVDNFDEGVTLVRNGEAAAIIDIWQNFTSTLQERFSLTGKNISQDLLQSGSIHIALDGTDPLIIQHIQESIINAMALFAAYSLNNNTNRDLSSLLHIDDPIYGVPKSSFTDFMAPGLMFAQAFVLAAGLISIILIRERKTGMLDRMYACGITSFELTSGYVLSTMVTVAIQVTVTVLVVIKGFEIRCEGSVLLLYLLTLLQGLCGVCYGWCISNLAESEASSMMLTMGTFYPMLFVSGILWPLEAAHKIIQVGSSFMPLTFPVEAVRWIMARGRGLLWKPVWVGFVSTSVWIIVFLVLSAVLMRVKR